MTSRDGPGSQIPFLRGGKYTPADCRREGDEHQKRFSIKSEFMQPFQLLYFARLVSYSLTVVNSGVEAVIIKQVVDCSDSL